MGGSSGGKDDDPPVVGYWYKVGFHLGWCQGVVDQVNKIWVGGRVLWEDTPLTFSSILSIEQEELFGGKSREGGFYGALEVLFGEATQVPSEYIQGHIEHPVPGYRGMLTMLWNGGVVSANNPYLKQWEVEVHRLSRPTGYNPLVAIVGGRHANPAYMIWECLLDKEWGMGYPSGKVDSTSFNAVASDLYNEGFGLSMPWDQPTTIEDFINTILDYIAGTLREDPVTGKFTLKLIRDEDIGSLPVYDESKIQAISSIERPGWGEIVNEIIIRFTDPDTMDDTSLAVQDLASLSVQGSIISETLDYRGIQDASLASRVASRELAARTVPSSKLEFTINRKAWGVLPGDLFNLVWSPLGIDSMICRCLSVDIGNSDSGYMTIQAAEDTFHMPDTSYAEGQPPRWQDPNQPPQKLEKWYLEESGYYDIVRRLGDEAAQAVDPLLGYAAMIGLQPTGDSYNYEFWTWEAASSQWLKNGVGHWAVLGYLVDDVDAVATEFQVTAYGRGNLVESSDIPYGYLGTEKIQILNTTYDGNGVYTVTCNRGILDTVPTLHEKETTEFWKVNRSQPGTFLAVGLGDHVSNKALTKSSLGILSTDAADTITTPAEFRKDRPYPPGNLQINGTYLPDAIGQDDAVFTWAHRDRLQQTAYIVVQSEGDIGPEETSYYEIRFLNENGTPDPAGWQNLAQATTKTFTLADEQTAWGLGRYTYSLTVQLRSVNDVAGNLRISHTTWDHTVYRAGWGLAYGYAWGGATGSTEVGTPVSYYNTRGDARS